MRNLLIIFAVKFCISYIICTSSDETYVDPCDGDKWLVYLVASENETYNKDNDLFMQRLGWSNNVDVKYYADAKNTNLNTILDEFNKKIERTNKQEAQELEETIVIGDLDIIVNYQSDRIVLIHLHAPDFYGQNYDDILKRNFTYAGHGKTLISQHRLSTCNTKGAPYLQEKCESTEIQYECKENTREKQQKKYLINCEKTEYQYNAKVVSDSALGFPALYDYIANFENDDEPIKLCKLTPPMKVIKCKSDVPLHSILNKSYMLDQSGNFPYEIYEIDCEHINNNANTIAILAPKPFCVSETIFSTTIFYDQPYTSLDTADIADIRFYNAIVWPQVKMHKMPFAIQAFMQGNNWKRVAIISDASETSKIFEQQLTALFDKENVIYTSRSCDVAKCDFTELLKPLLTARAGLIIANVGEEYADKLWEHVEDVQAHRSHLTWLVRAWPEEEVEKAINMNIGNVFSMTLDGDRERKNTFIMEAIDNYIRSDTPNVIHNTLKQLEELPETTHGVIARDLRSIILQNELGTDTNIKVTQGTSMIIARILVSSSNETTILEQKQLQINTDMDCLIKSSVYMKPCYDKEFMYFVLVVPVFVLMIVGIMYFFQSLEVSYSRMSH